MKKLLCLCLLIAAFALPAEASVESALEECRSPEGILPEVPGRRTFSSDVVVQEMKLRLLQGDRVRFDKLCAILVRYFQSPLTLLYTRLDSSLKPLAWENSTGVDLQACRVLLDAAVLWNEESYHAKALKIAGRILRHNVYHDVLIDGATWKERVSQIYSIYEPSYFLNLSIVDVQLLLKLQSLMPRWEPVAQRSLGILLAGSGGEKPRQNYNVEKRHYTSTDVTSTEYMWMMVHLIDGGFVPLRSMDRLLELIGGDPGALVKSENASVASAALAAYVLARTGRHDLSRRTLEAMEAQFGSGGLLCDPGKPVSVFDNLLYLSIKEMLESR